MQDSANRRSKIQNRKSKINLNTGQPGEEAGMPHPEPQAGATSETAESEIQNPKSKMGPPRLPHSGETPEPLSSARIRQGARTAVRELFEKASADPASDAYRMLEIMCLNEMVEAELKTREMDALEVFRARNQGRELEMKAARLHSQNTLAEAQTEKLRLQIRMLEEQMAQIREKALQASEAKKAGRPFDYERALHQISAVIGLRGGEEFLHDEAEPRAT